MIPYDSRSAKTFVMLAVQCMQQTQPDVLTFLLHGLKDLAAAMVQHLVVDAVRCRGGGVGQHAGGLGGGGGCAVDVHAVQRCSGRRLPASVQHNTSRRRPQPS